ncbi:MAG: hypothetical protein ABI658_05385 [Acidimicrobiales bacterium]
MLAAIELKGLFGDVVFTLITVAFFALAWLLVRLCERIAGSTDVVTTERGASSLATPAPIEVAS